MSIIKYLLERKVDVHARDADGWTALHNACSKVTHVPSGFHSQGTPLILFPGVS